MVGDNTEINVQKSNNTGALIIRLVNILKLYRILSTHSFEDTYIILYF